MCTVYIYIQRGAADRCNNGVLTPLWVCVHYIFVQREAADRCERAYCLLSRHRRMKSDYFRITGVDVCMYVQMHVAAALEGAERG